MIFFLVESEVTTAQRCCSETEKNVRGPFSSVLSQFKKKYHPPPPGNLKFIYSDIFQSFKISYFYGKNPISLHGKLNFTPISLGVL